MSTAGKVLTVLILLLVPVWILLVAGVAEINNNGTKAVQQLKNDIQRLEGEVKANQGKIESLRDQITQEQLRNERDQTVLRARVAELERGRSSWIEIAKHVQYQLQVVEAELKSAEATRQRWIADKEAEIKARAAAEAEVERLKNENADYMAQLARLRDQFKSTLEANREMVDRLIKKTSSRRS